MKDTENNKRILKRVSSKRFELMEKANIKLDSIITNYYLDKYIIPVANYILTEQEPNRKTSKLTQMIKQSKGINVTTTNRKTHMELVETILELIATHKLLNKKVRLNSGLVRLMGRLHDIGHTPFGHDGEKYIKDIMEDYGIGWMCHNGRGAKDLIYTYDMENKIVEAIKKLYPNITDKRLSKIKKQLWKIADGILCHNGEMCGTEFKPNYKKTREQFLEELKNCYAMPNVELDGEKVKYDKTLMASTLEGCLLRIVDITSYVAQDFIDGIREGIIKNPISDKYLEIFQRFGLEKEQIELLVKDKKYSDITTHIEIEIIKDIIKNSKNNCIRISDEMANKIYDLRTQNNEEIVKKIALKKDGEITRKLIRKLLEEKYMPILLEENIISQIEMGEKPEITPAMRRKYSNQNYIINFLEKISTNNIRDYEFLIEAMEKGTQISREEEVRESIAIIRNGENTQRKNTLKNRRIKLIKDKILGVYGRETVKNEEGIEERILEAIENNPSWYDDIDDVTRSQKIALAIGIDYIADLDERTLIYIFRQAGIGTQEEITTLKKKYANLADQDFIFDTDAPIGGLMAEQNAERGR